MNGLLKHASTNAPTAAAAAIVARDLRAAEHHGREDGEGKPGESDDDRLLAQQSKPGALSYGTPTYSCSNSNLRKPAPKTGARAIAGKRRSSRQIGPALNAIESGRNTPNQMDAAAPPRTNTTVARPSHPLTLKAGSDNATLPARSANRVKVT